MKPILCFLLAFALHAVEGFIPATRFSLVRKSNDSPLITFQKGVLLDSSQSTSQLRAANDPESSALSESEQRILGVAGTTSALVVFVSEYTLASTGCGLPAGPLGLYGLAEGISYLGVVGVAGYSVYTKVRTGSGLPAGPAGLLGAAEGLSFVAILAGLVVLAFQIANYGYIPNAVPMEGGMCS